MTEDSLLQPYHRFHEQTLELIALAEAGDWTAFEALLAERQQGMAPLGDNQRLIEATRTGRAEELRSTILSIQAANDLLAQIAETSRADLADQLRQAFQAEKAIDAYKG